MTRAFERLLADLSEAAVDYILVGGLAVAFCGHVRATEGVDLLVRVDDENLARLLGVLADFGEGSATELRVDDFILEEGAIRVVEEFPLDIYTQMSGYRYEDLKSMTTTRRVNDHTIRHLDIEGLITLKEESLRPKDQADVHALRRIREERGEWRGWRIENQKGRGMSPIVDHVSRNTQYTDAQAHRHRRHSHHRVRAHRHRAGLRV